MAFGDFDFDFREGSGDFFSQDSHHRILGMEVTGIDEIQTQILCIPELVVLHIRSDEGIASGSQNFRHTAGAAAAAHGHFPDRLAGIHIAQAVAAEVFLDSRKESIQRLLGDLTAAHKADTVHGIDNFRIFGIK